MDGWMTAGIVTLLALVLSWPLGRWMATAMTLEGTNRTYAPLARALRCGAGKNVFTQQDWKDYSLSLLVVNSLMFVVVFALLLAQGFLPLNPAGKPGLEVSLAFNTAISFMTNTNLQHYSGEVSLSYLSQLGLMWLQFLSPATGLAALAALARGLAGSTLLGNFYQDLCRTTLLILLPLALLWALFLAVSGVPMTFAGNIQAVTLEGASQSIARGPVACFMAIKQLGTNGGGFFGVNAAHPFENPSYWTNIASNLAILLIPMAAVWMFGRIAGCLRHAAIVFAVMLVLYLSLLGFAGWAESQSATALANLPVETSANLEGKELRFGGGAGSVWAVSTTATSNGSVNAMHDSLNPLTGLAPLTAMWLNVAFGGVGVGMINMFLFIVVAVFLAGMMVGRTPEYLARKVESREMKLALLALLSHPLFILGGVALFAATPWGAATVHNPGSHGFTEIVYEFSSAAANNGSGFEGLADNTVPWNLATAVVMLLARFIPIIAPLAIVGSLAGKRSTSQSAGTFRTDSWMFGLILLGTVTIVGALLFLPLAVLGPIAEQLSP